MKKVKYIFIMLMLVNNVFSQIDLKKLTKEVAIDGKTVVDKIDWSGVIRTVECTNDGDKLGIYDLYEYIYYKNKIEVAKVVIKKYTSLDKDGKFVKIEDDGKIIESTGNIPDGIVREGGERQFTEYNFKNNKREGIYKKYEQGKLIEEGNYKDDKLNGISKKCEYYRNDNFKITGELISVEENTFKDDKLNGISKKYEYYYGSGIINKLASVIISNYKDNKLDGILESYDDNNKLNYMHSYKDGKLEGLSKTFQKDGKLLKEEYYKDNQYNGTNKEYYANGKIKIEEIFENGQLKNKKEYTDSEGNKLEKTKSEIESYKQLLFQVQSSLELYFTKNKCYPENLEILIKEGWLGINQNIDPWGNKFKYEAIKTKSGLVSNYKLGSNGPDGKSGTDDDIEPPINPKGHSFKNNK